jgi:hypothetical protein
MSDRVGVDQPNGCVARSAPKTAGPPGVPLQKGEGVSGKLILKWP